MAYQPNEQGTSCHRWEKVLNRPYPYIVVELPFTDHVTDLGAKVHRGPRLTVLLRGLRPVHLSTTIAAR